MIKHPTIRQLDFLWYIRNYYVFPPQSSSYNDLINRVLDKKQYQDHDAYELNELRDLYMYEYLTSHHFSTIKK